jgi:hypothetical protein
MSYHRSPALRRWFTERRAAIDTLAKALTAAGEVTGPGRPLRVARPLAHAYVLRVVSEFQAFNRDLHDLSANHLARQAAVRPRLQTLLVEGLTDGRGLDRGNATMDTLQRDFRRIGLRSLNDKLGKQSPRWSPPKPALADKTSFAHLVELRNALAHGNEAELSTLRRQQVLDTVTWTRRQLPGLNRTARAIDRVVWDHLWQTTGAKPW